MKSSIFILCALLCLTAVSCGKRGDDGKESDTKGTETTTTAAEPVNPDPPPQPPETEAVTEPETEPETEAVTEPADPVLPDIYPEPADPAEDDDPPVYMPDAVPFAGQFASEGHKNLTLLADWSYLRTPDGAYDVTVTVGLSHYEIYAQEKIDLGTITLWGEDHLFSTPAISYDGAGRTYTQLYTETFRIEDEGMAEIGLSVSWDILAFYGGEQIDTLTAEGMIPLTTEVPVG